MNPNTVTINVRDDLQQGSDPFSRIMSAAAALRPDEQLVIVAPFEPVPLLGVLDKQGFGHTTQQTSTGDWEVRFSRAIELPIRAASSGPRLSHSGDKFECSSAARSPAVLDLDVRGLEPPQPLVQILEALATLPKGTELQARTERRPMHLYPQLEARGFVASTEEQSDGSYLTSIRHG